MITFAFLITLSNNRYCKSALVEVIARLVPGAKIVDVCKFGDELIQQRTATIFNKKNKQGKAILKGIAFPVCLSVNDVVCHCSPYESDETVSYCVLQLVVCVLYIHLEVEEHEVSDLFAEWGISSYISFVRTVI